MSDMTTDVAAVQAGAIGLGPHQMFHNNDDEVELMELGDKNAEGYDNLYVHGATHSQNEAMVGDDDGGENEELASSPLDILIARETEYEAWVASEAAREVALFDSWQRDRVNPFFSYQWSGHGRPRSASQAHLETQSVTLNVQPMRPRESGFRNKKDKHKANFLAMC